jgi:pimeloyl-ACP methyl ester carboxylesterase
VAVALDPAKPDGAKINLAVTIRQADPSKWTSPIVIPSGFTNWDDPPFFFGPDKFVGHDLIEIDARGSGRSDGVSICTDLHDYTGELNTWRLSPAASSAAKACIAKADPALLASLLDNSVFAADVVAVRRALGIDKWMMLARLGGADIGLHVLKTDGPAVTAIIARDPNAVGSTGTTSTIADAFDRFAADCAKVPKCAANGDMKVLLAKALDRLKTPVTTKTLEKATGSPVVLDAVAVQFGIRSALFDSSLTPLLPGLIAGLATGDGDELVAGFYASRAATDTADGFALSCQTVGWVFPPLTAAANGDHAGLFGVGSNQRYCDAIGPVRQMTPPPKITSEIPVLVILASYDPRSSEAVAKSIFAGFSHTTIVTAAGVPSAGLKVPCYHQVTSAFANAPTAKVDTACMSGADGNTFT